jgi:hypothetical protein
MMEKSVSPGRGIELFAFHQEKQKNHVHPACHAIASATAG